jgi:hypothetical protein
MSFQGILTQATQPQGTVLNVTYQAKSSIALLSSHFFPFILPNPLPASKDNLMAEFERVLQSHYDHTVHRTHNAKIDRVCVIWNLPTSATRNAQLPLHHINDDEFSTLFQVMAARNWVDHFLVACRGQEEAPAPPERSALTIMPAPPTNTPNSNFTIPDYGRQVTTPGTTSDAGGNVTRPFEQVRGPNLQRDIAVPEMRRGSCPRGGPGRAYGLHRAVEHHDNASTGRLDTLPSEHMGIADSRWNPSGSEKKPQTNNEWRSDSTLKTSSRGAKNFDDEDKDGGNRGDGSQWNANGTSSAW